MRWCIQALGRAAVASVVVALLPLAVVAHERRALGGDGGPGDERYIIDIGFRDEPVVVDQPNELWVWVAEVDRDSEPVEGLEASLHVEVEAGGHTVPLALVPQSDPGFYAAPFRPSQAGDYGIRLFGKIEQLPVDETFAPDVIDASWLELPATAEVAPEPGRAPRQRRGAQLIEEANLRAAHSQRLAYIGIALGTLGLAVGLLALARSGRPRP
ncbi:MAG: hypothetical protein KC442_06810 [Thermomicrobiales bacterium]|nr:hypothetical protein [Thermomicrobiales bacterium]